jgi:hypothetical protein
VRGEEWVGVGAFIAGEGDGSASGRWQRPTRERGLMSPGWRRGDVGGLASSRSEAKAERAGEGSLGFLAVRFLIVAIVHRRIGPGKREVGLGWAFGERNSEREGKERKGQALFENNQTWPKV